MNIATTIRDQIKTISFWALGSWGARQLQALEHGFAMHVRGPKILTGGYVEINLNGLDLYDITLYRIRKAERKEVASMENVYAEDLVNVLDGMIG